MTTQQTPNTECAFCAKPLHRNFSQQRSKSGLYFCGQFCKRVFFKGDKLCAVPSEHPIFKAMTDVYEGGRWDKQPEYLTGVYIIRVDPKYQESIGDYVITANARVNGIPNLAGKTPSDITTIRNCFKNVSLTDIHSLPEFQEDLTAENWKRIELKYWGIQMNGNADITYTITY